MDFTSYKSRHIIRDMLRLLVVQHLGITIEPSSASKQASPPLALAAYYESDQKYIARALFYYNNHVPTFLGSLELPQPAIELARPCLCKG
jgi:hypothetical protein